MPYCPVCKEFFVGDLTSCPKCGRDFEEDDYDIEKLGWTMIGKVKDKMSADFAKETLESYHIPVVIISESGYFGDVGLNLPSLAGKGLGKFQIHIPSELREDAENVLNMIFGDDWEKET